MLEMLFLRTKDSETETQNENGIVSYLLVCIITSGINSNFLISKPINLIFYIEVEKRLTFNSIGTILKYFRRVPVKKSL